MAGRRYGGHVRFIREDVYELRLYIGTTTDANGKKRKKYYTETFHGVKRDAYKRMADIVTEHTKGRLIDPTNITVGEYLEQWYAKMENGWKENTRRQKRQMIAHLKSAFGDARLCKIQPLDIEEAYERIRKTLQKAGYTGDGTLFLVHACLSKALRQAVRWRLIASNPADTVNRPLRKRGKRQVWTVVEQQRFLAAATRYRTYPLWVLLLRTGLRIGEALALCWDNINLGNCVLSVERTLLRRGAQVLEGTPKTESSVREVPLTQDAVACLRQWQLQQYKERLRCGADWQDRVGRVFVTQTGQPMAYSAVLSALRSICRKSDAPYIGIHGLRHTFATRLVDAGMDPKTGSELLGHSTVEFFCDNYVHPADERMRQAVLAVEQFARSGL